MVVEKEEGASRMRFSIKRIQGRTGKARAALGLLALLSLNLAAQPCVMASTPPDAATHGTPIPADISNAVAAERVAHRHLDTPIAEHHDCPHCDLAGHQKCTDTNRYAGVDAISTETTIKFKDAPASTCLVAPGTQTFNVLPFARESVIDPPAEAPAAGPPLSVQYCVYQI